MKTPTKTRSRGGKDILHEKKENHQSSECDDEGTSSSSSLPTKSKVSGQNKEKPRSSEYGDDTSSGNSAEGSTLSAHTVNYPTNDKVQPNMHTNETDIDNQNMCNKRNEKMNKPCKNGFCYCFTSDSDEFRIPRNNQRAFIRPKQTRIRKSESEVNRKYRATEENYTESTVTSVSSEHMKIRLPLNAAHHQRRSEHDKVNRNQRLNLNTKTYIDSGASNDAPLIHIVQEFYKNTITSEIRINKSKIKGRQNESTEICSKKVHQSNDRKPSQKHVKSTHNPSHCHNKTIEGHINEEKCYTAEGKVNSEKTKDRESKGGRLLQKRIGNNSFSNYRKTTTPPRKPPRSFSSCSENPRNDVVPVTSLRQAEEILDEFLQRRGQPVMKHNSRCGGYKPRETRKSYPLDKPRQSKHIETEFNKVMNKAAPSCPFISETDDQTKNTFEGGSKIGWLLPNSEIAGMLNCESRGNRKEFNSMKLIPQPQIGWTVPVAQKLEIDTVDGINKIRETDDFHNFAKNMESKSTPVKSEFSNQRKSVLKGRDSNESLLKKDKIITPKTSRSDLSLRKKATSNTKLFLKNSKQKIVEMVKKKNDKETTSVPVLKRNVAIQTSTVNLNASKKINFESCNDSIKKTRSFSLQSPPGSYFSNSSKKNSPTDFDFERTINSPKFEKSSQRRLTFSPKKLIKGFSYRQATAEDPADRQYYKSFESEINQDFNLSAMNDVLMNIKAKLEASDDHATRVFQEVEERQSSARQFSHTGLQERKESYSEYDDMENLQKISAHADVHNEPDPMYSEIEEDRIVVTGNPSIQSLNEVSHYVVNTDVIYAKVNKVGKSKSYNNVSEKHSSPKFRKSTKSELWNGNEIFVDNFNNNKNVNAIEVIENIDASGQMKNQNDETIDCFASFKGDKDVSYESPGEVSYTEIFQKSPDHESKQYELNLRQVSESNLDMGFDVTDDMPIRRTNSSTLMGANNFSNAFPAEKMSSVHNSELDLNNQIEKPNSSPIKFKSIKNKLRASFRKGRAYLKNETKRISNTMKQAKDFANNRRSSLSNKNFGSVWDESDLGINELYADSQTIENQLKKAVTLCRKISHFESSLEAVEAERLLLYSTLKTNSLDQTPNNTISDNSITIDSFKLGICTDLNRDIFFNYFYIGVFSFESQIKSTDFGEKHDNNTIQFRNCKIVFGNLERDSGIKCDIYLLRLRKILNVQPQKEEELRFKMENVIQDSSDSAGTDLLSRFKLQGSFMLYPHNCTPFRIHNQCTRQMLPQEFCLYSDISGISIPINLIARSTYLQGEVNIEAKVEVSFNKMELSGFLNVQDIKNMHNWNRLWCQLDITTLNIWSNPPDDYLNEIREPILSIDLSNCFKFTVQIADRSLCARPRTFLLNIPTEIDIVNSLNFQKILFSADNQSDLNYWIDGLNGVLGFIESWMSPP